MVTRGSIIRTNFAHSNPRDNHNILFLDSTTICTTHFPVSRTGHARAGGVQPVLEYDQRHMLEFFRVIHDSRLHCTPAWGGYGIPGGLRISLRYVNESPINQSAEHVVPVSRMGAVGTRISVYRVNNAGLRMARCQLITIGASDALK